MGYPDTTFFDKVDNEGDSNIYVGISYLRIVAKQIDIVRESQRIALNQKGDHLFIWLNEMKVFRDLIENRTGIQLSTVEIDSFCYEYVNNELKKNIVKIQEKEKYTHLFNEIEKMIERNAAQINTPSNNPYKSSKYLNDKKIILELSNCWRELLIDANRKHLIMPEGLKDMKALAKSEWIDRDIKKDFNDPKEF